MEKRGINKINESRMKLNRINKVKQKECSHNWKSRDVLRSVEKKKEKTLSIVLADIKLGTTAVRDA